MKDWLLAALLTASAQAGAASPVQVRFGNLLWLHSKSGLPRLQGDKLTVPLPELCTLLAAHCTFATGSALVEGVRVPVLRGQNAEAYARLSDVAGPLRLKTNWDARARMVSITGEFNPGSPLRRTRNEAYGFSAVRTVPTRPVKVSLDAKGTELHLTLSGAGVLPGSSLTLFIGQPGGNFSMMSPHGLGSPDLPKGNDFCSPKLGRCEVTISNSKPVYVLGILEQP